MKLFRIFLVELLLYVSFCVPSHAQWQTPIHSVPIGNGGGSTGFNSAGPGAVGTVLTGNGSSADPTFQAPAPFVLPTGIDANVLNAQNVSYAIAPSDNGKTVYITGGPFTLTLPSVSGFASNAVVSFCNGNPNSSIGRSVRLSGFPSPFYARLYMQQCGTIAIESGAWVAKYFPGRFRPTFTPSWFVDPNGSNANDGFISAGTNDAYADVNQGIAIAQNEYDLTLSGVPAFLLSPTVFPNSSTTMPRGGTGLGVFYVVGNGGIATLRTAGSVVWEMYDFAGYIIFANIQFDCSFAGSHPCYGLFLHQQSGVDLSNGSGISAPGTFFNGGGATDLGIWCDSVCKVNSAAPITYTGTWGTGLRLDLLSVASINAGMTATGVAFGGPMIQQSGGSQLVWSGQLTLGGGASYSRFIYNSNAGARFSTFTVSGALASGQSYLSVNNGWLCNASATAIPGTVGATTAAGSTSGFAVATSGTCDP